MIVLAAGVAAAAGAGSPRADLVVGRTAKYAPLFLALVTALLVGAAPAAAAPRAHLVKDIYPGRDSSSPSFFTALGDKLLFQGI